MGAVGSGPVVAILVGPQASGKSTFAREPAARGYAVVSQDAFPNARRGQRRQPALVAEAPAAGRDVMVDTTNLDDAVHRHVVAAATSLVT